MSNPLQKFFRQPALYINLPSQGQYWPQGSLDLNENQQVAVYPMTARDELTLKTPDALMNGQSVVDCIKSCIPQIKDPWQMPGMDVDYVLIAIRIASYGENMEFKSTCPECNEQSPYELHLPTVLDGINVPDYEQPLQLEGMNVYLKPQNYRELNQAGMQMYQEQKMLATVNDSKMSDEEKITRFKDIFKDLTVINLGRVTSHIRHIETQDGVVSDVKFIGEFLDNAPKQIWDSVQKYIQDTNTQGALPPNDITCDSCQKNYQVPIEFDYSTFFA